MIVKSMSRKVPSFGQLIGYIDRDEGQEEWRIRHNVWGRDPDLIRGEFERNGELLQKRKNGVYLYHEIISITRANGLSPEEQKQRLRDIAENYISARCPDNLVFGNLHQDKDHSYHYHLMISANRAGETGRLRLTKAQFREVQVGLERHVLEKYPELEQKVAMDKRSDRGRKKGEAELERRTGKRPKREEVLERVTAAYEGSQDRQSLLDALGREGLELYVRGKNLGVVDLESGKNHRLKTLDLDMADRVSIRMEGGEIADEVEPLEPELDAAEAKAEPQEKTAAEGEKEKEQGRAAGDRLEPKRKPRERDRPKKTRRKKTEKTRSRKQTETEADNQAYGKKDSNADLKSDFSKQEEREAEEMPKRHDDPETGTQYRDPEIPDAVYNAAEALAGTKKGGIGGKLTKFAKKVVKQGAEEARNAGDLLRRGFTGDHEPSKDQTPIVDNPILEAKPTRTGSAERSGKSAQQEKWRSEINRSRAAGRDDPEQGRE
jgi:hypothetical protein